MGSGHSGVYSLSSTTLSYLSHKVGERRMDPGYGSIAGVGPDTCGSALVRPCRVAVEAQRRLALSGAAACRPPPKTEANAAHRWREPDSAFNSPLVHNPTPLGARFPPGPVLCMRSLIVPFEYPQARPRSRAKLHNTARSHVLSRGREPANGGGPRNGGN